MSEQALEGGKTLPTEGKFRPGENGTNGVQVDLGTRPNGQVPASPPHGPDTPQGKYGWLPLLVGVAAPALTFALLFVAVPPAQQNFPLNDDTLYSRTAELFARSGGQSVDYFNHASMPMFGLLLWVTPFLWVFGYSQVHVVLRVATMLLSLLGLVGFYDLLRREGRVPAWPAAFTVACLGLGPLYFLLGSMFHTDVTTLAYSLLALACYGRGLRSGRLAWWGGGMLFALLAVLTRQNAIAAPAAAGIVLVFRWARHLWSVRGAILQALIGPREPSGMGAIPRADLLGIPGASLLGFLRVPLWLLGAALPGYLAVWLHKWFNARQDVEVFSAHLTSATTLFEFWTQLLTVVGKFENLLYMVVHAVGLFALPVLFLPARYSRGVLVVAVALIALVGARFYEDMPAHPYIYETAPYIGNCLTRFGQFATGSVQLGSRPRIVCREMEYVLTVIGIVAGGVALARGATRLRALAGQPLFVFTVLHLGLLALCPNPFDRYFLVLMPGALAAVTATRLREPRQVGAALAVPVVGVVLLVGVFLFQLLVDYAFDRSVIVLILGLLGAVLAVWLGGLFRLAVALATLAVFAVLSFATVRDFLTWNNAMWELGRRAEARGIDAQDIEGGFSWNGYHCPRIDAAKSNRPADRGMRLSFTRSYTPNVTGRYAISFSVLPGTRVLDREPYQLWLLSKDREREMYFLEPDPGSPLFVCASTLGFMGSPLDANSLTAAAALAPSRFDPPPPP